MLGVDEWLGSLPPVMIFLLVGSIILLESMGVPLPGEITLISAALLAATGNINIWGVAVAASVGAIVGDSIGYAIGRRGGRQLLETFGRRFPKHFGPSHLDRAERTFAKWGVWAVFFGRFVALLRILAGPLAGALHVPYRRFLVANAAGGIVWAFGTSFAIYVAGHAAEAYLKDFSWIALALAIVIGLGTTLYLRRRATRAEHLLDDDDPTTNPSPVDDVAAVAVHSAGDAARSAAAHVRRTPAQGSATAAKDGRGTTAGAASASGTGSRGAARAGTGPRRKPGAKSGRRPPKPRS